MATSARSLGIALGFYIAIFFAIMLAFSILRLIPLTKRLYAPKRYKPAMGKPKPKRIRNKLLAWVWMSLSAPERAVIEHESTDAAVFLLFLRFGMELFAGVSLIVLVIILPINLCGQGVSALLTQQQATAGATSNYTFWLATPEPTIQDDSAVLAMDSGPPQVVKPPEFYEKHLPPAPAGLEWWEYRADIPLLPQPSEVLGPAYARYGWRYDASYQAVSYTFSDLDKTTLANISPGSPRLYAHAVVTWLVTLYALRLLWRYNKQALRLRIQHLISAPPGAQSHTALLRDVPGLHFGTVLHRTDTTLLRFLPEGMKRRLAGAALSSVKGLHGAAMTLAHKGITKIQIMHVPSTVAAGLDAAAKGSPARTQQAGPVDVTASSAGSGGRALQGYELPDAWLAMQLKLSSGVSMQQAVEEELRELFGDQVDQVLLVYDTTRLDPLVHEYQRLLRQATDYLDHLTSLRRRERPLKPRRLTVVPLRFGRWGLQQYGQKPVRVDALQFYRDRLVELRRQIGVEQAAAQRSFMPTAFVTFQTRRVQVVAAHSLLSHDMSTWRCSPAPGPEEVVWGNLGWRAWERRGRQLLMWGAFAALALFFMIPVTAVQSLLALNSVVGWLQHYPIVSSAITAVLPGLALRIFLALLPWVLRTMLRFSGAISLSAIDLGVVSRYFIFQLITVFFGSFIAGSFSNQLKQFIDSPSSILTVLGTAAPATAIFFFTFLMLQALLSKPLGLLQPVTLVLFVARTLLCATERAKARLWQDQTYSFGTLLPDDTIAILLGLTFCVICPLIAPMALLCLVVEYVIQKYKLLFVVSGEYESGGKAWPIIFNQVMVAVGLFQLVMLGLLGIKRAVVPPLLVLPLPFLSLLFWYACRAMFLQPQRTLALADAARLDRQEATSDSSAAAGPEQGQDSQGGLIAAGRAGAAPERAQAARRSSTAAEARQAAQALYVSPSFKIDDNELTEALCELDGMLHWLRTKGSGGGSGQQDLEGQGSLATTGSHCFRTAQEEEQASTSASRSCPSLGGSPVPADSADSVSSRSSSDSAEAEALPTLPQEDSRLQPAQSMAVNPLAEMHRRSGDSSNRCISNNGEAEAAPGRSSLKDG